MSRKILNDLTWLPGRAGAADLFVAMDRDTYKEFVEAMCADFAELDWPDHIKAANRKALEEEATRDGLTKIEFMGCHICICNWVKGIAWEPYTANPALAPRAFVTGRV